MKGQRTPLGWKCWAWGGLLVAATAGGAETEPLKQDSAPPPASEPALISQYFSRTQPEQRVPSYESYPEARGNFDPQSSAQWLEEQKLLERRRRNAQILFSTVDTAGAWSALGRLAQLPNGREAADSIYDSETSNDFDVVGRPDFYEDLEQQRRNLDLRAAFCRAVYMPTDSRTLATQALAAHFKRFLALPTDDREAVQRTFAKLDDDAESDTNALASRLGANDVAVLAWDKKQLDDSWQKSEIPPLSVILRKSDDLRRKLHAVYGQVSEAAFDFELGRSKLFVRYNRPDLAIEAIQSAVSKLRELHKFRGDAASRTVSFLDHKLIDAARDAAEDFESDAKRRDAYAALQAIRAFVVERIGDKQLLVIDFDQALRRISRHSRLNPDQFQSLFDADARLEKALRDADLYDLGPAALQGRDDSGGWYSRATINADNCHIPRYSIRSSSQAPPPAPDVDVAEINAKKESSIKAIRTWLRDQEAVCGQDDVVRVRCLGAEAVVYAQAGDFATAVERYRWAIDYFTGLGIAVKETRELRAAVDELLFEISVGHWENRRWTEAAATITDLRDSRSSWLGPKHWLTREAGEGLAEVEQIAKLAPAEIDELLAGETRLAEIGKSLESSFDSIQFRQIRAEIDALAERRMQILAGPDPLAIRIQSIRGDLEAARGNFDLAAPIYDRAVADCERTYGKLDPEYVYLLRRQAYLQVDLSDDQAAADLLDAIDAVELRIGQIYPTDDYNRVTVAPTMGAQQPMLIFHAEPSKSEKLRRSEQQLALAMSDSDFVGAEEFAREGLRLATEEYGAGTIQVAVAESNLASVWVETGDYVQAEVWYRRTLDFLNANPKSTSPSAAKVRHNLAIVAGQLDRLDEACTLLDQAIAGIETVDPTAAAQMRQTRGSAYRRLARLPEALQDLKAAKIELERSPSSDSRIYPSLLCELGLVEALGGNDAAATAALDAAEKIIADRDALRVSLEYGRGVAALRRRDEESAVAHLLEATRLAIAQMEIACVFQTARQQVAAGTAVREYLDALLTVFADKPEHVADVYGCVLELKNLGMRRQSELHQLFDTAELGPLLEDLRSVNSQISSHIRSAAMEFPGESMRSPFPDSPPPPPPPQPCGDEQAQDPSEPANPDIRPKQPKRPSRGSADDLNVSPVPATDKGNSDLRPKRPRTTDRGGETSAEPVAVVAESDPELDALRARRETLERQLVLMLKERRTAVRSSEFDALVAAVPPDAVFVDVVCYCRDPWFRQVDGKPPVERLTAFVAHHDGALQSVGLGDDAELSATIGKWRDQNYGLGLDPAAGPGVKLRTEVWTPLENRMKPEEVVVLISPDGSLAQLPFVALPGKAAGKYLVEESRSIVQTAAPFWRSAPSRAGPPAQVPAPVPAAPDAAGVMAQIHQLLLVGDLSYDLKPMPKSRYGSPADGAAPVRERKRHWDPLPGSKTEVAVLRDLFEESHPEADSDYKRLTNRLGSKATVMNELPDYRYIHFATHGFFERDREAPPYKHSYRAGELPSLAPSAMAALYPGITSGLVLAGANPPYANPYDDGILTAYEIASLDLRQAELVVLSACETALGDYQRGEGQFSVQWAFHMAGAKSCIAGLWKVPDSQTSRLMQRFYENLWTRKMTKLEALKEAQVWMLRDASNRGADVDPATAGPADHLAPFYWAAFTLSGDWR